MKNVICILVLYNPDVDLLCKVISSIINQVDCLWISDNSPLPLDTSVLSIASVKVCYKKMHDNVGIAAAQNVGIQYAIEEKYRYIYFIDQDSISPDAVIDVFLQKYAYLSSLKIRVGGIAARPYNRCRQEDYRGLIIKGKRINEEMTEVKELISSSLFVDSSVFDKVGLMEEELFIDGVDHEWCWRAIALGHYRFFVIESMKLEHQIGEGDHSFGQISIQIPTPFRIYYQYRNFFRLLFRSYVPIYWKLSNGFKYIMKFFYFPLFVSPRITYLKKMCHGIYDGIIKV